MISTDPVRRRHRRDRPCLVFSPLAWLKLQFFCHAGDTEIAGFGITAKDDPLHVVDFVTIKQRASMVTVAMDDEAVADFMDRFVDLGMQPQQFLRIWCHTHPGSSPNPSGTDEDTFERVFGACDWAVMFIISRTGATYARLSLHVGPGMSSDLPVSVDWAAWPDILAEPSFWMDQLTADWHAEFHANINSLPEAMPLVAAASDGSVTNGSPWESFAETWDWNDLDQQLLEEHERHARIHGYD